VGDTPTVDLIPKARIEWKERWRDDDQRLEVHHDLLVGSEHTRDPKF